MHIPYRRFLIYDVVCATLVVTTFFFLAYLFGESVIDWSRDAEITVTIAVILICAGIGLFLYVRSKKKVTDLVMREAQEGEH